MIQAIEAVCIHGAIQPLEAVAFEESEPLVILRLSKPTPSVAPVSQPQGEPREWRRFVGILKGSPHFNDDPVAIQKAMRDEWG